MHKDNLVAWTQFEHMVRTGVPHAMDIAAELFRFNLEVPVLNSLAEYEVDLQFYCVLHSAYRKGVLARFLTVMQRLKTSDKWDGIRSARSEQMFIVELCQRLGTLSCEELTHQILKTSTATCTHSKSVA